MPGGYGLNSLRQLRRILCGGRVLILLAGSTRTKHFACSDVLTRWRWAERPVMVHCQSGKTSQDISDLAEGPTNAPQRKGFQSGYGANAAPKGANAWDNNIDLVDLNSYFISLHRITLPLLPPSKSS